MSKNDPSIDEIGKEFYGEWWNKLKFIILILLCGLMFCIYELFK